MESSTVISGFPFLEPVITHWYKATLVFLSGQEKLVLRVLLLVNALLESCLTDSLCDDVIVIDELTPMNSKPAEVEISKDLETVLSLSY